MGENKRMTLLRLMMQQRARKGGKRGVVVRARGSAEGHGYIDLRLVRARNGRAQVRVKQGLMAVSVSRGSGT